MEYKDRNEETGSWIRTQLMKSESSADIMIHTRIVYTTENACFAQAAFKTDKKAGRVNLFLESLPHNVWLVRSCSNSFLARWSLVSS